MDMIKVNIDGSFFTAAGQGGWGVVARDADGVCFPRWKLNHAQDALQTEAEACLKALAIAQEYAIQLASVVIDQPLTVYRWPKHMEEFPVSATDEPLRRNKGAGGCGSCDQEPQREPQHQRSGMSSAVLYGNYPGSSLWQEATPGQRTAAMAGCIVLATAVVLAVSWCFSKAKAKPKATACLQRIARRCSW
ncbi:hypothetical protein ZWY2020_016963 [Hordeum vulgare]|nr:hypothetical protein ZWY2020_016963 [Hordeum vulgare]